MFITFWSQLHAHNALFFTSGSQIYILASIFQHNIKEDREDGLDFFCQTDSPNKTIFGDGTECIVTCPANFKPTDPVIQCSCFR